MGWCFDMSKAPRGRYVIMASGPGAKGARKVFQPDKIVLASACGVVTLSHYLPEQRRWDMFTRDHGPIAWAPYEGPKIITDDSGKLRRVANLPPHPTMAESWIDREMRRLCARMAA